MPTTTTVTVPTDPDAYLRWLAGRMAATAAMIRRDSRVEVGPDEREALTSALAELHAALDG